MEYRDAKKLKIGRYISNYGDEPCIISGATCEVLAGKLRKICDIECVGKEIIFIDQDGEKVPHKKVSWPGIKLEGSFPEEVECLEDVYRMAYEQLSKEGRLG